MDCTRSPWNIGCWARYLGPIRKPTSVTFGRYIHELTESPVLRCTKRRELAKIPDHVTELISVVLMRAARVPELTSICCGWPPRSGPR